MGAYIYVNLSLNVTLCHIETVNVVVYSRVGKFHMKLFEGIPKRIIEFLIDEIIICMTNAERNRQIMKRRYLDGVTFERLGEEFSMSDWQVKHIVKICGEMIKGA